MRCCWRFIFLVIILIHLNCIICQDAMILVHPLSVNTTVNSGQVNFSCEARAEFINFRVNNIPADDANIANKGFHQQDTEHVNNTIRRRVLLVDPREGNNNTNISCVAITTSPLSDDISNTALLLIQGLLDGVRDLTVNITSTNTVILSWSAPYTLDNTYINVYNITITNTLTNEIETYFTESLQLSYQSGSNETNPCTEITVDIFAINTAGNGIISNVSFYFPKVPHNSSLISMTVTPVISGNMVHIIILVNVTHLCPGEYPTNGIVDIKNSTTGEVIYTIMSNVLTSGASLNITNSIILSPDMTYIGEVTLSNLDGTFNTITDVNFTTHGIQNVIVNINPGSICIICYYINGATELGCLINLLQNDIIILEKQFLRSPITASTSTGCVNIVTGLYDLYVYDIENDNSSDNVVVYKEQNILVIESSSTQVITSTISVLLSTITVDVITSLMISSPSNEPTQSTSSNVIIVTSIISIIVIILISIVSVVCVGVYYIKKIQKCNSIDDDITIQHNISYEDTKQYQITMTQNTSYELVTITPDYVNIN